jgi:hypothetical protein
MQKGSEFAAENARYRDDNEMGALPLVEDWDEGNEVWES